MLYIELCSPVDLPDLSASEERGGVNLLLSGVNNLLSYTLALKHGRDQNGDYQRGRGQHTSIISYVGQSLP